MRDPSYEQMTSEEEMDILEDLVQEHGVQNILSIGDIYSELKEHFNNEILDRWVEKNPEKAYGQDAE